MENLELDESAKWGKSIAFGLENLQMFQIFIPKDFCEVIQPKVRSNDLSWHKHTAEQPAVNSWIQLSSAEKILISCSQRHLFT